MDVNERFDVFCFLNDKNRRTSIQAIDDLKNFYGYPLDMCRELVKEWRHSIYPRDDGGAYDLAEKKNNDNT